MGQVENLRGKYLLSGFLACRVCGGKLVAQQRGRHLKLTYICATHRAKGDAVCQNSTAVPMTRLHAAVIASLRDTLSPENFERLLKSKAENEQERVSREAERTTLIGRIADLNAQAERLADAVAAGSGTLDVLLNAIKARQAEREQAEARLAEVEDEVRAIREAEGTVERLRTVWKDWQGTLDAEPVVARQLLRKVLVGPIGVLPKGLGFWEFLGTSRFDALLHGKLTPRADAIRAWSPAATARQIAELRALFPATSPLGASAWAAAPIAGTSDSPVNRALRPESAGGPDVSHPRLQEIRPSVGLQQSLPGPVREEIRGGKDGPCTTERAGCLVD